MNVNIREVKDCTISRFSSMAINMLFMMVTTCVSPGGVLGFWGGVGSMGAVFLLVVLTQRYCCRRRQDKEEAGQVLTKPH